MKTERAASAAWKYRCSKMVMAEKRVVLTARKYEV